MDPTGETAVENPGCRSHCISQEAAAESEHTHISGFHSSSTPGVFYTYFYNHVHRLRLEKLLYIELSIRSNGYF
jgi:hypothetical protein